MRTHMRILCEREFVCGVNRRDCAITHKTTDVVRERTLTRPTDRPIAHIHTEIMRNGILWRQSKSVNSHSKCEKL